MNFLLFFLNRSLLVNVILVGTLVSAGIVLFHINRNQYPTTDIGTMQVKTIYPGASSSDIERSITRPIEEKIKSVSGIKSFRSVSSESISLITIIIDPDRNDQQEIKNEIRQSVSLVRNLPDGILNYPEVKDLKSSELPILTIGISGGENYELRRTTAKMIERNLKQIEGVSMIDKYGYRNDLYEIILKPQKLKSYGIALNDILYVLSNHDSYPSYGQGSVFSRPLLANQEDIEEIIVLPRKNFPVRIKNIADVQKSYEKERLRTTFNGKEGISLVIRKKSHADIIQVVDNITKYIQSQKKNFPPSIIITPVNDTSKGVRNRMKVVQVNALIGFVLVALVLTLFLNFVSSLLVALSIPICFGVTLIVLYMNGFDINVISLVGMIIALGMIVDQSIVVSENSFYYRAQGYKPRESILKGISEVASPVTVSVLTTVCAFIPMFFMTGIIGKFIYTIPLSLIVSICASLMNCFLILPCHLRKSYSKPRKGEGAILKETKKQNFFDNLGSKYEILLKFFLKRRFSTVITSIILLSATLVIGFRIVPINLFPSRGANTFYIFTELVKGSTYEDTQKIVEKAEEKVLGISDQILDYYTVRIGTDQIDEITPIEGREPNKAVIQVVLTDFSERKERIEDIMESLRKKILSFPEFQDNENTTVRFEIFKQGPPAGTPIDFRVHSPRNQDRAFFIKEIKEYLKNYKGVSDIRTSDSLGKKEYKLKIDYNKLSSTGLSVKDISQFLMPAFERVTIASMIQDGEEIGLTLGFPDDKNSKKEILDLYIRDGKGRKIPVRSFAKLILSAQEADILHVEGNVTSSLEAQTSSGTLPRKVIDDILKKFNPVRKDYPDLSFSFGGEAEETVHSVSSLIVTFGMGALAIYLIFIIQFRSLSQPLIVMLAIPFGLFGVIWVFWLHGFDFSFTALLGVVGLSGIVVNHSLLLVDFINRVVKERPKLSLIDAVSIASVRRLRPILLTTLTTVVGLLPAAYGIGGSDPIIEPMVLAIAWGVFLSAQISLILIPCFYLLNQDIIDLFRRLWMKKSQLREGL